MVFKLWGLGPPRSWPSTTLPAPCSTSWTAEPRPSRRRLASGGVPVACCLSVVTLIMVQVSQSITDGLKALRGDKDSGPGRTHDRDRDPDKHGRWTWSDLSVCLIYKIVVNI